MGRSSLVVPHEEPPQLAARDPQAPRRLALAPGRADRLERYFTSKKGVSTFALTSQVLNEPKWTPDVVARRQVSALEALKKVWSLG